MQQARGEPVGGPLPDVADHVVEALTKLHRQTAPEQLTASRATAD